MTEREYFIAINSFVGFGAQRVRLLVKYFGSSGKVFGADENELLKTGISKRVVTEFAVYRNSFNPESFDKKLREENISILTDYDKEYPRNLRGFEDSPGILFVRGHLKPVDKDSVAIVGSRRMTYYGREVTKIFATGLANAGVTVVSGLAFGVDLEAHRSTLEVGGRCIAVLASGIDLITPRSNYWLGKKILDNGGAIISEYPPGIIPQKYFFPYRNRIISGLSRAVIVIEGLMPSGTIHTARHAANQGKAVFAVPGQITSPYSQAPHFLLKEGALVASGVGDILKELNISSRPLNKKLENVLPGDNLERKILEIFGGETLSADEIARTLDLKVSEVSVKLTAMQLKGRIRSLGNGMYVCTEL